METIKVDKSACVSCGLCAKVCPRGLVAFREGKGFPLPVFGFKSQCIKCGHCVAVCPKAALSLPSMKPEDCQKLDKSFSFSAEAAELFLKTRRSIRVFKKEPLPREALERLLRVADYAPTGLNSRPVSWTVFEKPEDVKALGGMVVDWMRETLAKAPQTAAAYGMDKIAKAWALGSDPIMRGAPHLFVARAPKAHPLAAGSACIALEYLELGAHSLGLGACWAGYFHFASGAHAPLRERLGLGEGEECFGGMLVGASGVSYERLPVRPPAPALWK